MPALAAGATSSATTSPTLHAGTGTGNYCLIAQVDGDNTVAETQEGNNTIPGPHLTAIPQVCNFSGTDD